MCGALMEMVKIENFFVFFSHERHEPMLRYFMGYPLVLFLPYLLSEAFFRKILRRGRSADMK